MKTLFNDLTEGMTPIEWAGFSMIGILGLTFIVTFLTFIVAVITGDADLANASYGIADLSV